MNYRDYKNTNSSLLDMLDEVFKDHFKNRKTKTYGIKKVIFNQPATIVYWEDGTKTVVKCQEGETFDKEKGLALAIVKYVYGNQSNYNNLFKKYVTEE